MRLAPVSEALRFIRPRLLDALLGTNRNLVMQAFSLPPQVFILCITIAATLWDALVIIVSILIGVDIFRDLLFPNPEVRQRGIAPFGRIQVVCASISVAYSMYRLSGWSAHQSAHIAQWILGFGDQPVSPAMELVFGHAPACVWSVIQIFLCYVVIRPGLDDEGRIEWLDHTLDLAQRQVAVHPMYAVAKHKNEVRTFSNVPAAEFWANAGNETCPICLADFEEGDRFWTLPCNHYLHESCAEEWWKQRLTCVKCTRTLEWRLAIKE
ncbi:uncharacterized protein AB675_889 [Cyphellophora attinorum]|uniref:RING-type domain-containing protein n=1 Tax=Cyphellophora attinorum TaxID=1664694 RepID=A0A0N1HB02_9EURO|nr:uncharacterized protein AB675_889 [Phialophora attinorum]KPI45484.1 hypothetical protein AB675_889 [Phialophora attinorum]